MPATSAKRPASCWLLASIRARLARAEKAAGTERAANSFEVIACEWIAKQKTAWVPAHSRRILQNCGQVMRYAVATGRAERDIAADLRGALSPVKETHRAAITDPQGIGGLFRAMDVYSGSYVTRCALRLAPLLFVRPGELRQAEWAEFDLDAGQWNIPAERMKMREAHLVPLASQAVAILRELRALTGQWRYVFPSARGRERPMSKNAVLSALRRVGYAKDEMSGHGFRAMARTILDEVLHLAPTTSNTNWPTLYATRTAAPTTAPRTLPNAAR